MTLLQVQSISYSFGKLQALTDFNLTLARGEIVGIIGPNGAGKTTLFNVLCGIYTPQHGDILLNNKSIVGLSSDAIARQGVARTFQNIRLFKKLSALDNIRCVIAADYSLASAILNMPNELTLEQKIRERAWDLLRTFKLEQFAHQSAESLPYGLQRRLEIARAVAINPQVLLLDEPACGMNHHESQELKELIQELMAAQTLSILLIDHQIPFIMSLCPKIMVLDFGRTIAVDTPEKIKQHPEVIRSYLGEV